MDPTTRLGYRGAEDVKNHPFFKVLPYLFPHKLITSQNINWKTVRIQKPPFVPKPQDSKDTSYFDARAKFWSARASTDNTQDQQQPQQLEGVDNDDGKFAGFWYVNFQSLSEFNKHVAQGASKHRRHST